MLWSSPIFAQANQANKDGHHKLHNSFIENGHEHGHNFHN
jgi:hypothetical protein